MLLELFGQLLGIALAHYRFRFFHQGQHIPHAQDPGSHTLRMETLELVQLFAHTHEFDGLAGHSQHGQRRTASCIGIQLGHEHAVDAQRLVECLCHVDCILTGHSVHHEHDLVGFRLCLDLLQLIHELFVNVEPAGGIENDHIVTVILGIAHGLGGDHHRVDLSHFKDLDPSLFSHYHQLVDRRRTVDIAGNQQGAMPFPL